MKKTLLLSCFLIFLLSCTQEKNCKNFKIGTFRYIDDNHPSWIIIRNDSVQIEKDKSTKTEFEGKLEWKSECEYTLTYTKISDSIDHELIGNKINVEIINTSDDIMEYEATMGDKTIISKMKKIN